MRGYKYKKSDILKTLKLLLTSIEFEFENQELALRASFEYEKADADFSDILIGITNHHLGCNNTFSFDKSALKSKYFQELV